MRKLTLVAVGLAGTLSTMPASAEDASKKKDAKPAEVRRPAGGTESKNKAYKEPIKKSVKQSPESLKISPTNR